MANSEVRSVLAVDDDLDTCKNLSDILSDLGYHVDVAHDGGAALELVRQRAYDVALLDLKMPGMDGVTLYREMKKLRAGTVAIIVTAYAASETAAAALAAGAWQIIPKPVNSPRLLELVNEAFDQPLVMVVDDDHDLCTILWDVLRESGYRVCIANNELQAAGRLKDRTYKAVLVDMKLSNKDGGEQVCREVRKANPTARVILITGYRTEMAHMVEQLLTEGADAVCYKPFDMPELLSTVERLARKEEAQEASSFDPRSTLSDL